MTTDNSPFDTFSDSINDLIAIRVRHAIATDHAHENFTEEQIALLITRVQNNYWRGMVEGTGAKPIGIMRGPE